MLVILDSINCRETRYSIHSYFFDTTLCDTKCTKESLVTKLKIRKEKLKNKMRSKKYIVILTFSLLKIFIRRNLFFYLMKIYKIRRDVIEIHICLYTSHNAYFSILYGISKVA